MRETCKTRAGLMAAHDYKTLRAKNVSRPFDAAFAQESQFLSSIRAATSVNVELASQTCSMPSLRPQGSRRPSPQRPSRSPIRQIHHVRIALGRFPGGTPQVRGTHGRPQKTRKDIAIEATREYEIGNNQVERNSRQTTRLQYKKTNRLKLFWK